MDKEKLFRRLATIILVIFFVNLAANTFYWYSSIWYFDMIMHFLGGFWVGLLALYIFKIKKIDRDGVIKILLSVVAIGVGWELYEIVVNEALAAEALNYTDIFSDLVLDLLGGIAAIIYFFQRIMKLEGNKVQS